MPATPDGHPPVSVNPWRVYAECFVLSVIGRLSEDAQRRLTDVDAATLRRGQKWREVFETEFSVTDSLIAAIRAAWSETHEADPTVSPEAFARLIGPEVFGGLTSLQE